MALGRILTFLVVEDEILLAMDIEAMIEDAGHSVVGEAASLEEVQALSENLSPDVAFVDMQLAGSSCGLDVAELIQRRWAETVVIFVTANPKKVPSGCSSAHGTIQKPFSRNGLTSAILYLSQGIIDPPPKMPQPSSFHPLAPLSRRFAID